MLGRYRNYILAFKDNLVDDSDPGEIEVTRHLWWRDSNAGTSEMIKNMLQTVWLILESLKYYVFQRLSTVLTILNLSNKF